MHNPLADGLPTNPGGKCATTSLKNSSELTDGAAKFVYEKNDFQFSFVAYSAGAPARFRRTVRLQQFDRRAIEPERSRGPDLHKVFFFCGTGHSAAEHAIRSEIDPVVSARTVMAAMISICTPGANVPVISQGIEMVPPWHSTPIGVTEDVSPTAHPNASGCSLRHLRTERIDGGYRPLRRGIPRFCTQYRNTTSSPALTVSGVMLRISFGAANADTAPTMHTNKHARQYCSITRNAIIGFLDILISLPLAAGSVIVRRGHLRP